MDDLDNKIISSFLSSLLAEDCLVSSLGGLLVFRAFRVSSQSECFNTCCQETLAAAAAAAAVGLWRSDRCKNIQEEEKTCWTEQDEDVLSSLLLHCFG